MFKLKMNKFFEVDFIENLEEGEGVIWPKLPPPLFLKYSFFLPNNYYIIKPLY